MTVRELYERCKQSDSLDAEIIIKQDCTGESMALGDDFDDYGDEIIIWFDGQGEER